MPNPDIGKISFRHGYSRRGNHAPGYDSFHTARQRCTNPKSQDYPDYGGRGIKFLFVSFTELVNEIGLRPSPLHTLDRRNNDGNYECGNVRWITAKEQIANRRIKRLENFSTEALEAELKRRKER